MQENELLHLVSYPLQEATLAFMVVVYALRLIWLFRFKDGRDLQARSGRPTTGPYKGAAYSMANVAMPWTMESTRTKPLYWVQFVVFHLGVAATIALSFIIPYAPRALASPLAVRGFQLLAGLGFLVGCYRMGRRIFDPSVRAISTPDDYFALGLMMAWFVLAFLAAPGQAGAPRFLFAFFLLAALFHLYVPFSKILHYLYYPFIRYYLGRTLGYRGVYPLQRVVPQDTK
jgi:nitrate reductase gamma subunit